MDVNVTYEQASALFNSNDDVYCISENSDGTTRIEFCEEAQLEIETEALSVGVQPEVIVERLVKAA